MSHYRGKNDTFGHDVFKQAHITSQQTIDQRAVNVHNQDGIAEISISYLQHKARSIIVHAINFWPEMISAEF